MVSSTSPRSSLSKFDRIDSSPPGLPWLDLTRLPILSLVVINIAVAPAFLESKDKNVLVNVPSNPPPLFSSPLLSLSFSFVRYRVPSLSSFFVLLICCLFVHHLAVPLFICTVCPCSRFGSGPLLWRGVALALFCIFPHQFEMFTCPALDLEPLSLFCLPESRF